MLTADIDLGGSEDNQWMPIGNNSNRFKGNKYVGGLAGYNAGIISH